MHFTPLKSGPLQVGLLPAEGSLRYVYFAGHEIIRGIAAPVRDEVWATIRPQIANLRIGQAADSFQVSFDAHCRSGAVDFDWHGEIRGSGEGTLVFTFDGIARSDFLRNRIGFCLLHGAEMSGSPVEVENTSGGVARGIFPKHITTGAPFTDIRAFRQVVAPGLRAEILLEGDAFEMEDQRNWTDASFKTYCTPLRERRPVMVRKGDRISQRITVRLLREPAFVDSAKTSMPWEDPAEVLVEIGSSLSHVLPTFGTTWNSDHAPEPSHLARLRPAQLSHLRVDLAVGGSINFARVLSAAAAASHLGAALEVALHFEETGADEALAGLFSLLRQLTPAPRIARWLVFQRGQDVTPADCLASFRHILRANGHEEPTGGGAKENFAELNASPQIAALGDFSAIACNPQVHAFDEASMVETLPMHREIVENASRLSGARPVIVSPITLTRRWRVGEIGAPVSAPREPLMPLQVDQRHASAFAAAWTAGSIAAVSQAGACSATYFEALGANGLLASDGRGVPFLHVFELLAPLKGTAVFEAKASHPAQVAALALETHAGGQVLLANLAGAAQRVRIRRNAGEVVVTLPPHGVELVSL